MRSYQIVRWGAPLEERAYPTPEPRGSEVLLRVECCGICRSDVHMRDGWFDLGGGKRLSMEDKRVPLPLTLGHEVAGEVVAVGPRARGVRPGDRRIVYPWIGCLPGEPACPDCSEGRELVCRVHHHLGTKDPGGFSDCLMVPHPRYLVDYEGLPVEWACTLPCAGLTAYAALRRVGPLRSTDVLLVMGAGGLGQSALALAGALVRGRVVAADVDPAKRASALAAGAHAAFDPTADDAAARVAELTGGRGLAAVVDFVGSEASVRFGAGAVRKGATVVVVGLFGGAVQVPVPWFPMNLLSIRGSYVGTLKQLRELVALARAGRFAPLPIDVRPLDGADAALDNLKTGRARGRLVLRPSPPAGGGTARHKAARAPALAVPA